MADGRDGFSDGRVYDPAAAKGLTNGYTNLD